MPEMKNASRFDPDDPYSRFLKLDSLNPNSIEDIKEVITHPKFNSSQAEYILRLIDSNSIDPNKAESFEIINLLIGTRVSNKSLPSKLVENLRTKVDVNYFDVLKDINHIEFLVRLGIMTKDKMGQLSTHIEVSKINPNTIEGFILIKRLVKLTLLTQKIILALREMVDVNRFDILCDVMEVDFRDLDLFEAPYIWKMHLIETGIVTSEHMSVLNERVQSAKPVELFGRYYSDETGMNIFDKNIPMSFEDAKEIYIKYTKKYFIYNK